MVLTKNLGRQANRSKKNILVLNFSFGLQRAQLSEPGFCYPSTPPILYDAPKTGQLAGKMCNTFPCFLFSLISLSLEVRN